MILSARSSYFQAKLKQSPSTRSWTLPTSIPPPAFDVAAKFLYLGELPKDLDGGPGTGHTEEKVLHGLDKVTKHLEIQSLWDDILESGDRRMARQRRTDELARGRDQLEEWFKANVLKHQIHVPTSRAKDVKWDRDNGVFADVLLRADCPGEGEDERPSEGEEGERKSFLLSNGIPIGPSTQNPDPVHRHDTQQSVLFPVHRAMLLRSDYFLTMFSSGFREAQESAFLHVIHVDCTPDVLEVVLSFLYCEKADFGLDIAIEVLFAAEMLLIDKLKTRAATLISTLGNGAMSQVPTKTRHDPGQDEPLDVYEVVRAGWLLRIPRLEEFGARYFAYRLEDHIDDEDFAELIRDSASRIQKRQETDSIELLDDIRFYLSERFRLRFEDTHLEEMMDETSELPHDHTHEDERSLATTPHVGALEMTNDSRPGAPVDDPGGAFHTLDGEIAGDEFARDALHYQTLLGKIDMLLEKLKLDA